MPVSLYVTKWETIEQYEYPENWQEIKHGLGYWREPMKIVADPALCYWQSGDGLWTKYDPKHPKCPSCGKFVRAGRAWKYEGWTGPCHDCYENIYRY